MIKTLVFFTSIALLAGATAETPQKKQAIVDVQAPAAAKLLADKKAQKQEVVILDVRTPREFKAVRIANSKNIDFVADSFEAKLAKLDKDKAYLVLCQSGARSRQSLAMFKKLGFTEIYHLDGGIMAWIGDDLPVAK